MLFFSRFSVDLSWLFSEKGVKGSEVIRLTTKVLGFWDKCFGFSGCDVGVMRMMKIGEGADVWLCMMGECGKVSYISVMVRTNPESFRRF